MPFSSCFLRNEDSQQPIELQLLTGKQYVGRSRETKIRDLRCSKKQVECQVDFDAGCVSVRVLGANGSAVHGRLLRTGETVRLRHGDRLELLPGQHSFTVCFSRTATGNRQHALDHESARRESTETPQEVWTSADNDGIYIFMTKGVKSSSKIAAFDLDGTIITTKSGKVFPKDKDDWQLLYPEVPGKLKQLVLQGFKVVFITNQMGIAKGKLKPEDVRTKVRNIAMRLAVPLQCLISPHDRWFRKPRIGMWEYLCKEGNGSCTVDVDASFYCGDAAGRLKDWLPGRKKDFSCSDRLFALNIGLPFCTPEERFLGQPATTKYHLPEFDPRAAVNAAKQTTPRSVARTEQEVVVLVGPPGSGKSYVTRTLLLPAGYVAANRDTLKSWQKCVQLVEEAVKQGKCAAVDNTNGDRQGRARYLQLGSRLGVPVRCLWMETSLAQAKHNNKFRELTDPGHQHVGDMVINMFNSRFEEPSTDEGFSEITRLACTPTFSDNELERLYSLYLAEK